VRKLKLIVGMLAMRAWGLILIAVVWATHGAAPLPAQTPQATHTREGFAQLPGVRIWYIDSGGDGIPVVFLHAATGSSRVWEYQIRAFTAAGYRFIAYDRRGWGRSVIDPSGPQPGTGADDLENLINHLKIERFHLVGTAAGAMVAMDYALSFPQRLRSLVIANTIGAVVDEDFQNLGRRIRPSPQFEALPPDFKELGPSYRAANREGTERWLEFERSSRPPGPALPAQTMRKRITLSALETIKTPTLLMAGGADLYAPPPVMEIFTKRIQNSEFVTIPDAGHSSYWETPNLFNRAVLDFIREH
jgi:pimeloyl-ACP methyl ester carboxylesterase